MILRQARRNDVGRISGREETNAEVSDTTAPGAPAPVTDWNLIAERAITLFSAGFREWDERDALLYLAPTKWGTPKFQEVRQELVVPLFDARGKCLPIVAPYTEETADTLVLLEQFQWKPDTRVLGSLRFREGGVYLEPLVLYQGERTIHLTLDQPLKESPLLTLIRTCFARPKERETAESLTGLAALLNATLGELEIIAEGGASVCYNTTRLEELAASCSAVGLTHAAAKITQLLAALATMRHTLQPNPAHVAQTLLHTYYVLRQMRVMDSLLQATAGLR